MAVEMDVQMTAQVAGSPISMDADTLLRSYLETRDEAISERLLEELLSFCAEPQVRKIIRRKLSYSSVTEIQDMDDICSDVLCELLGRLRDLKEHAGTVIQSFNSYTAVTAYRAFSSYLRRRYPQRHRLKTRLRYLLNTEPGLALWEDTDNVWVCGRKAWSDRKRLAADRLARDRWVEAMGSAPPSKVHPGELLQKLFSRLTAPVEFDELVGVVAEIWGVIDQPSSFEEESGHFQSRAISVADEIEQKQWLAHLWEEIRLLPVPQRQALLLNLRLDQGGSALALVPLSGVASIRKIASTLEMAAESFAELWNRLPLDDKTIGNLIGVTRQQVINLRKSARARLTRRMVIKRDS